MGLKCIASGTGWSCDRAADVAGRCDAHYQQLRRGSLPQPIREDPGIRISGVTVPDSTYRALIRAAKKAGVGIATIARRVLDEWAERSRHA